MKRYIILIFAYIIFVVNLFANDESKIQQDSLERVLILNSMQNLARDELVSLLRKTLDIPNQKVEIEYSGTRRTLSSEESKQLSIALLRLNLKNSLGPGNIADTHLLYNNLSLGENRGEKEHMSFNLYMGGSELKVKLPFNEYSIAIEEVNRQGEGLKNPLNLITGAHLSKEANLFFRVLAEKYFRIETRRTSSILYENLFSGTNSCTPKELEKIYGFAEYFIKSEVGFFAAPIRDYCANKDMDISKAKKMSDDDKCVLLASIIRSKFFTDLFVNSGYSELGYFTCTDPYIYAESLNFISINRGETLVACRYLSDKSRNGLSVALEDYYTSGKDAPSAPAISGLPLFYKGKNFVKQASFVSPELRKTMLYLSNKYK